MTDLPALIAKRLTHDLAGPLGAVMAGLDLLDGADPEIRSLIADGTAAAIASLRLHRFILAPGGDVTAAQGLLAAWVATREGMTLAGELPAENTAIVAGLAMTVVEAARRGGTLTICGTAVSLSPPAALDASVTAALAGATPEIARAALAGILFADAARTGGSIRVDADESGLTLAYQGSALPR